MKPNTLLHDYVKSLDQEALTAFAARAETSVAYLTNQVAFGHKNIGPLFALKLESASDGALKAHELCPTFDWAAAARGRCDQCRSTHGNHYTR